MKEIEIRTILARLCRDLDATRAKSSLAIVGTTVALGSGCGGTVEESRAEGPGSGVDAALDANADVNPLDAAKDAQPDTNLAEAGSDAFWDVGFTDGSAVDAADDGPTPVYMSACLPPDPEADPAG